MKWFKHDSDANTDAKLKRVRMKYGMEGYGLYWYCLELIASGVDKHRLTFELEHDSEIIAYDTGIHRERVEEMMCYFVDLSLFENVSGTVTCLKMANRTDEYIAKMLRGGSGQTPDKLPTQSGPSTDKVPSTRTEQNRLDQTRGEEKRTNQTDDDALASGVPQCPHQSIIDLYHETCLALRRVGEWTPERQKLLRSRWRENTDRQSLDWWRGYFERVAASDFLCGRTDNSDFTADLEWLVRPKNMPKVLEGKYDNSSRANGARKPKGYVDNSAVAEEAKRLFRERNAKE